MLQAAFFKNQKSVPPAAWAVQIFEFCVLRVCTIAVIWLSTKKAIAVMVEW